MLRYIQRPGERNWFERPEDMSPVLHRLLIQRGIASAGEAREFLNPGAHQLHDPFLLSDMRAAAARIRRAMDGGERICIWGDYDVDGVCASAILYDYFQGEGVQAQVYLPSRHSEGYGLNENGLRQIAGETDLLVTVDCGIASHDLIALAQELGMDCIVTDHHRPGEILPDCPVVNPHLPASGGDGETYPCPICGAGVAFKLVQALGGLDAAMQRVDLAAIATVADVVQLIGENRAIVYLGLKQINHAPRPGVAALMEAARAEKGGVKSETIAFRLAPRLNAGGRLGSARRSFELLVQTDPFMAFVQADELEQENARRQSIEREIRAQAEEQLQNYDFSAHRILLVHGEGWNSGVIGLTASHMKEKYHYPVIAMAEEDGMLVGSCRSIEGVDIYQTLNAAAHLLERFGGHSQAAGLSVKKENLAPLQAALDAYLCETYPAETWTPAAAYDIPASLDEFSEAFVRSMEALEPTGCGNPESVFRTTVQLVESRAIGAQGAHLRLICAENGARRTGIYFGAGSLAGELGQSAEILFTPQLNSWNGRTEVQIRLHALREGDTSARIDAIRPDEGRLQRKFLTDLFYNRVYQIPQQADSISLAELKRSLVGSVQGTWIICADLRSAQEILRAVQPAQLDLCIGRLSADERCFNSVILCPEGLNAVPRGVRRLIFAGMPASQAGGADVKICTLDAPGGMDLPDVDEMRQVYKAVRAISRRPAVLSDFEALDAILAQETGISPLKCHASILTLWDMKLVEIRQAPFQMALPPMQKTDPDSSAVWRALQGFREKFKGEF